MSELLAFLKSRRGRYSITIAAPDGAFLDIRYDSAKDIVALIHELSNVLQAVPIEQMLKDIGNEIVDAT